MVRGTRVCARKCIEDGSMPEPNSGCWIWLGVVDKDGYGMFTTRSAVKQKRAHRACWVAFYGAIPEGMFVCHNCDTPSCVNPEHLFLGTLQDNTDDKVKKNRQCYGVKNGRAVLTETHVREIRRRYAEGGITQRNLGAQFGVTDVMVSFIIRGKSWSHVH